MDKWKDDIEKYISGKLTPAERHALEKRALSDPFLADALEGAESISGNEFSLDVERLNQKIAGEGKNRWSWPLRIAASVAGIALVATAIFFSMGNDANDQLASNKKTTETKPAEVKATDSIDVKGEQTKSGDQDAIASVKPEEEKRAETKPLLALELKKESQSGAGGSGVQKNVTATSGPSVKISDSILTAPLMAAQVSRDTISTTELSALLALEEKASADVVVAAPTQQPIVAKTESASRSKRKMQTSGGALTASPAIENLVVTGQVRDQQGQSLPGVNINVKGSTIGAVTDGEGKYAIALSDSNATLIYSFIGFVAQEMKVDKANDYADVQLMEDATQLSEVVVTGYGEKRTDGEPVVRLAEPIGGRKAYDTYLDEKKIYPTQALENKVEGKVVIEFTVSTTGALSDFNVIRKIGFGCEEEVIRLVKEGPGWYPSYIDNEAVESLVRIKTRFDLPGK
jgi:CarboxypepD_reg-like domain/Gram-negative bacterial TonB protein C-terminal